MREVTDSFFIGGQIMPEALEVLKDQGFDTIICNRPDEETEFNPGSAAMQAAADSCGIRFAYVPVNLAALTEDHVAQQRAAMQGSSKAFAYCRSGMRSAILWGLASAGDLDADGIIGAAANAGFDISGIRSALG